MYSNDMYLKTDHVQFNKPLQHCRNICDFPPDLNIGDPDGSFAGDGLVDDEVDVEVDDDDVGADGADGVDADPRRSEPQYWLTFKGRE